MSVAKDGSERSRTRLVDIPRLVEGLAEIWTSLARHQGTTLVCDIARDVPRRLALDGNNLRIQTARGMVNVLEDATPGSVVHFTVLAGHDEAGAIDSLRCRITALTQAQKDSAVEDQLGVGVEQFSVAAEVPERLFETDEETERLVNGARVLYVHARLADDTQSSFAAGRDLLEQSGAQIHESISTNETLDILRAAAVSSRPFDLCILDVPPGTATSSLVSEIHGSAAFSRLPVVIVDRGSSAGRAASRDAEDGRVVVVESEGSDVLDGVVEILDVASASETRLR